MRFRAVAFLFLSLILRLSVGSGHAQEAQPSEYQLKAAFLFNFAKFVEWPPSVFTDATSPIVIGIFGETRLNSELERTIRDKTVNNRPLAIKEFRSLSEATNCHILFISTSEKNGCPKFWEASGGQVY